MMRGIITWSLRFRLLVVLLAAGAVIAGISQLREAPVDVLPEFSPPYIEIQTEALGLSASEVEEFITVPLEGDLLNGVAGISTIRSESVSGLSSVTLVFEEGTDILGARQLVQERLTQAHALPNVSKPPAMLQPLSSASRVMMVGLRSDKLSLIELGLLARWTLKPRLLGVPGVANVAIWGQREHQLQVQVDPQRLRQNGVSLQQIIDTTGNAQIVSPLSFLEASTPGTGGFIDTPSQRLQIRHILPIGSPQALAKVPLTGSGRPLGSVTTIVEDHQPLIGEAVVGGGPGLLLVVEKFPGANTLEVSRGVEDAIAGMRAGLGGVQVDTGVFRPADFLEAAIDNLMLAVLIGGALLALLIVALTAQWRIAVVSLVSIPLSLVVAATTLHLLGQTMNFMLLAGLALGAVIVVDDAVVSMERIRQRWRATRLAGRGTSTAAIVREALIEVRAPLGYATLIILATAAPLALLGGRPGAFFQPLALSYAVAVLASLLVSLTVAPALTALLLGDAAPDRRRSPIVRSLDSQYERALSRILRQPSVATIATVASVAVALIAIGAVPQLRASLVPSFNETAVLVELEASPGTSRPEMVRLISKIGRELRSLDGVRNVGAHMGRAVTSDATSGMNTGVLWVSIDRDADHDATVAEARRIAANYPGLDNSVVTYSDEVIEAVASVDDGAAAVASRNGVLDVLTGAGDPVAVRIYGKDLAELRKQATIVRKELATVDGVVDPRIDVPVNAPTIEVEANLAAAERFGIKPGDIRRAAATLVQGIEVGSLFEDQKVFEVLVVGTPQIRENVSDIRNLLIDTPNGGQVRLAQVADVRLTPAPSVIRREAASRHIDVTAGVSGRNVGAVLGDVERRLGNLSFPLEYRAELLDNSRERDAAQLRLLTFGIAAALALFLLLQAAFSSWRLAAIVTVALPVAMTGGVLALFATGNDFSIGALAGLLAVLGLAARQAVLLVTRYRTLEGDDGRERSEIIAGGARERLLSVLATAGALLCFFLPVLVLRDVAGLELIYPMAIAVAGGVITSSLLTLFLLPVLYLRFAPGAERARAKVVVAQTAS